MIKIYNASQEEKTIIKKVVKTAYGYFDQKDIFVVEISIVSPDEIQKINAETRKTDAVTDVLSFPEQNIGGKLPVYAEDFPLCEKVSGKVLLGSILICRERAKRQAEEYGHSQEREIGFLTAHGILHLFGFDHVEAEDENIMREHQRKILTSAGYTV